MDAIIVIVFFTIIILAIVLDFVNHRTNHLLKRLVFYSFIFYLLNVFSITLGHIMIPPDRSWARIIVQFIPFYFISDWIAMFKLNGADWLFWNSVKLSFYNLIMLAPLGLYLSILFNISTIKKAALMIFLSTLTIETFQLFFSSVGIIIPRSFDVDDLILNTTGGIIGFVLGELAKNMYLKLRRKTLIQS